MSTIVECRLPAEEFALHETLARTSSIEFEVVRLVANGEDRVLPYLWASGESDPPCDAIEHDSTVENVSLLADLGGAWLYSMDWIDDIEVVLRILVQEDGVVLNATGTGDDWHLRVLFPERDAVSRTYDYCQNSGLTFGVENVYSLEETPHGQFGLTEAQYAALLAAFERGYFAVPREVTMKELADELEVSQQALSERLRRAHATLVQQALVVGTDASTNLSSQ